jgi:indole-3-glycerol phosphate synthase
VLDKILQSADERADIADRRLDALVAATATAEPLRSFKSAISGPGLSVIAEIKRRSPSAGDIDLDLDPVTVAMRYQAGGADAISVLTEPHFFGGSLDEMTAVREAVSVPVLIKDFTRSASQIWEARGAGADAVLLIVTALSETKLRELVTVANDVGIDVIVEAHSVAEVAVAADSGAGIIGVNNRDLRTFATDLSVAEEAAAFLPDDVVTIGESGVSDVDGAKRMASAGYDAILVGEALVRSDNPAALVTALKGAR